MAPRESTSSFQPEDAHNKAFGEKKITFWGSFCLNLNNNTGPGIVIAPLCFQQAGWFTPTLAILITFVLSSFAATMLCEAMQMIPGNKNFEKRYEFATTVQYYWGYRWYYVFQILYTVSMQFLNIAAMIISAQVVDQFVTRVAGRTYAIDYQTWPPAPIWTSDSDCPDGDEPWMVHGSCQDPTFIISLGFIIVMAICIPFGYINLDDNMWFQWFSMWGMVGFSFAFFVGYFFRFPETDCVSAGTTNNCTGTPETNPEVTYNGPDRTPLFSMTGQSQVLGVAVFTFTYVTTIPSWVNEKIPGVSVNKTIWWPAFAGAVIKIGLGLFAAWAYSMVWPDGSVRDGAEDILNLMTLDYNPTWTQYMAYIWDITTLIPGIPVLAIMVRYNLLSGKVCGPFWSFFWGVVAPWIITAFCYETDLLSTLCNWVSIVVSGYINFVVPCLLYRTALLRKKQRDLESFRSDLKSETSDEFDNSFDHPIDELEPLLELDINKATADREVEEPSVRALPETLPWLQFRWNGVVPTLRYRRKKVNKLKIATGLAIFFTILSTFAVVQNVIQVAEG